MTAVPPMPATTLTNMAVERKILSRDEFIAPAMRAMRRACSQGTSRKSSSRVAIDRFEVEEWQNN